MPSDYWGIYGTHVWTLCHKKVLRCSQNEDRLFVFVDQGENCHLIQIKVGLVEKHVAFNV